MLQKMRSKRGGFTLIELMIVIAIIAILAAILVPNFIRARAQGQVTACKSNLKNIATALEMYSTDYGGRFPTNITSGGVLTPNYLRTLPTCPGAGSVTYETAGYSAQSSPDAYNINCNATNHKGVDITVAGYPQYNSASGLVERP